MPETFSNQKAAGGVDQRVIAYIQATSQITLNFASMKNPDDHSKKEILRYVTIAFSVFCEYLCA